MADGFWATRQAYAISHRPSSHRLSAMTGNVRKAAVAGSWYPGTAPALAAAVDRHLVKADHDVVGDLVALVAPHAGLMYSGPVAAHAYRLLRDRRFDVAVLVGPSHFVGFDGVSIYRSRGVQSPVGVAPLDETGAQALPAGPPGSP